MSWLYLLDANVLIDANRDYYPLTRVPEFWSWLEHQGERGNVTVPAEVFVEIRRGTDRLADWCKTQAVKSFLKSSEVPDVNLVRRVVSDGYADDLTDEELLAIGRDPFLVAYGLVEPDRRCVVTTERSRPSRVRANRHLPDVCKQFGVRCCDTFTFLRELDFRTDWKAPRG